MSRFRHSLRGAGRFSLRSRTSGRKEILKALTQFGMPVSTRVEVSFWLPVEGWGKWCVCEIVQFHLHFTSWAQERQKKVPHREERVGIGSIVQTFIFIATVTLGCNPTMLG